MHRPDVLDLYAPGLQYAAGLVAYVHRQLGLPIASTAPLAKITDRFTAAVLSALLIFRLQPAGFTHRDLRTVTGQLRGREPDAVSTGQMTYDLRRLRLHGLIERIPHTHRYKVSDPGMPIAMFLTRVHDRFLPTGLAHLTDPTSTGPLRHAAHRYQQAIDALADSEGLAA